MIWITGDLHGGESSYHVYEEVFSEANVGDIVFCTGDLGGVWYPDYHTNEKHQRDENRFLNSILRDDLLWLSVDGNHENFARLFGGEFPLVDLFGGKAYRIREHVYYLRRGDVFVIDGKTFLAFGGAASHDKKPEPVLAWSVYSNYSIHKGRTEGVDWWPEEVPSEADYDNACRNLDRVGWKVDYVISHTCPLSQKHVFDVDKRGDDPVEAMLQNFIDHGLKFGSWHFGHFHREQQHGQYECHYNSVRKLSMPGQALL